MIGPVAAAAGAPRVVIVGAGFAGLAAAKALRRSPVRLTIVDRRNFHTFQPLLYQVASAGLGADDIAHSVRGIFHDGGQVDFRLGEVTGLDRDARRLLVAGGDAIPYDWLIVAAGASTNTFGVPGVDRHAFPLKSLGEALALRNHVLAQFEAADRDPTLVDAGALTFVVVGGGPTGVELAGALSELFRMVLARDFPRVEVGRARVVLLEATDHLLGPFAPPSRRYARERLIEMGVEVRLGATVADVAADAVHLASGEEIPTRTTVWVAGVRASPLGGILGFELDRGGRVVVDRDLRVPGRPDTFVVGDLAAARDPHGVPYPQLAPVAIQEARHAARQLERLLAGGRTRPFRFVDKGTMATIGRNAAVAELPFGIRFRGRVAWVAWLFLHLLYLVGFRNRVNVLVNWGWNYLTYDRGARLIVRADRSDEPRFTAARAGGAGADFALGDEGGAT